MRDDLENRFSFHTVRPGRDEDLDEIRTYCGSLAARIDMLCPDGREKSLALTKIEEAMFWANAAIAREAEE